jgi:hypothetical protein
MDLLDDLQLTMQKASNGRHTPLILKIQGRENMLDEVHLLIAVRTVQQLWQSQGQNQNFIALLFHNGSGRL